MAKLRFAREKLLVLGLFLTLFSCTKLLVESPGKASGIPGSAVDLHCESFGRGPPLLLLHGFGGGSYVWRHLKERLADRHRVILVDLKGFGKSPKPDDRNYSITDQADLISGFILSKNLENLTIIGHSLGGAVALVAAAKIQENYPGRISSLVLIDTVAYPQELPFFIEWLRLPVLAPLSLILLPDRWMVRQVLKKAFYQVEMISREIVELYSAPFRTEGGRRALVQTARQILPSDIEAITALYKRIEIPTLILWCRQDRIVPLRIGRRLHEEMPNSHLVVMENCGHIPQEEKPEETAARILRFLAFDDPMSIESKHAADVVRKLAYR